MPSFDGARGTETHKSFGLTAFRGGNARLDRVIEEKAEPAAIIPRGGLSPFWTKP
jgi:hypothetical protein